MLLLKKPAVFWVVSQLLLFLRAVVPLKHFMTHQWPQGNWERAAQALCLPCTAAFGQASGITLALSPPAQLSGSGGEQGSTRCKADFQKCALLSLFQDLLSPPCCSIGTAAYQMVEMHHQGQPRDSGKILRNPSFPDNSAWDWHLWHLYSTLIWSSYGWDTGLWSCQKCAYVWTAHTLNSLTASPCTFHFVQTNSNHQHNRQLQVNEELKCKHRRAATSAL